MIACVAVAGASVGIGHAEVNVHLYPELPYVNGAEWDEFLLQLDNVAQTLAVVAVLSQFIVKSAWTS